MIATIQDRYTSTSKILIGHDPKAATGVCMTDVPAGAVPTERPWAFLDWHPGDGLTITQESWVEGLCPGDPHYPEFERREYRKGAVIDHYRCKICNQGEERWQKQ
jgi:hypothetical protein